MPATKEVIADEMRSIAWFNQTPMNIRQTGRDGSNPDENGLAVRSKPAPSPVLIVIHTIYPACGISGGL